MITATQTSAFVTGPTSPSVPQLDSAAARSARANVDAAIVVGDVGRITSAYLDYARQLVDDRRLALAALELERGIQLVKRSAHAGGRLRLRLWPLFLSLSVIYDGMSDP